MPRLNNARLLIADILLTSGLAMTMVAVVCNIWAFLAVVMVMAGLCVVQGRTLVSLRADLSKARDGGLTWKATA